MINFKYFFKWVNLIKFITVSYDNFCGLEFSVLLKLLIYKNEIKIYKTYFALFSF